jgi:periplasmic protein TonB
MVNLKPAKQENRVIPKVNRRGFSLQKLLLFILASILVHGLGLILFTLYLPPKLATKEKTNNKPIDFVVIPEKPEVKPEPKVEEIEPEVTPSDQSSTPKPSSENIAPPPEPKPIEPKPVIEPSPPQTEASSPPANNPAPVLSNSDAASNPVPQPQSPVATSQPSTSATTQPEPPQATAALPKQPENSASSLLGGDYQKTLANSGDAFFSPEALEYKAILNPQELELLKDFDLEGYQRKLYNKVKSNWQPSFSEKYTTWLTFKVKKNGQISQLQVLESSGSTEFDRIAVESVNNAAPLEPLPSDFPLEHLEFNYQFYLY